MRVPEAIDQHEAVGEEFYVDEWLWTKIYSFRAGELIVQHVHEWDHPTIVAVGKVRFWIDDEDRGVLEAPKVVTIRAGQQHKFLALTDAVICCVHNLRGEGYPAVKES